MSNTLNLSGADMRGFDAIPSARYDANVYEVTAIETDNPEGKLPVGTPGINVQFRIDGGDYDNRRVFTRYYFAPDGYEKKAMMDGMVARFLVAVGYSEDEVKSGNFSLDADDLVGRECAVQVRKYTYNGEDRNEVTGVRPRQAAAEESEGAGLL